MARASLNYLLAALLATSFLGLAFTGVHMGFIIPADINALWGVSHRWWARVHFAIALVFMLLVILHFALHYDWLSTISHHTRLRSMARWSAVVVVVAAVTVFAGLRSAPVRARVSQETTLGQRVFLAQECDLCHAIKGVGGTVGPDLSHVGARRDRAWLREEIIDPESHQSHTQMPAQTLSKKQLDALVDYLEGLK